MGESGVSGTAALTAVGDGTMDGASRTWTVTYGRLPTWMKTLLVRIRIDMRGSGDQGRAGRTGGWASTCVDAGGSAGYCAYAVARPVLGSSGAIFIAVWFGFFPAL